MTASFKDLIFFFLSWNVSNERRQKDPVEFIKNLNFAVDAQTYINEKEKLTATLIIFRLHLRDKALFWYHDLNVKTQANWQWLEAVFIS